METDKRVFQKNYPVILFALALVFFLSGCIFVPIVDSVKQIGVTSEDRARLLDKEVKLFSDALYWGNESLALKSVLREFQPTLREQLREHQKAERRVVSSKMLSTDLNEGSWAAEVIVQTKTYEPATLIVKETEESQRWVFSISDGWKLQSRAILKG